MGFDRGPRLRFRGQDCVQGRVPHAGGEEPPFDGKGNDQERSHDQARNAEREQGKETADVIAPLAPFYGCVEPKRNAHPLGKKKSQETKGQRDWERLPDDIIDRMIAVFGGESEVPPDQTAFERVDVPLSIPLPAEAKITGILLQQRFIHVILGLERSFNFRRGRFPFLIEGAARHHAGEQERQERDHHQQGKEKEYAP